jgi:hypothetical protein
MTLDGYSSSVSLYRNSIDSILIDRWTSSENSMDFNKLKSILWRRPSTNGAAVLHNNNIESSEGISLRLRDVSYTTALVNATGNYWGPQATAEMQAGTTNISRIYDFYDDTSLVRVDWSGFLTSPVPNAGPDW